MDLEQLKRLCAEATPGEWTPMVESDRGWYGSPPEEAEYGRFYYPTFREGPFTNLAGDSQEKAEAQAKKDADFLCAARTALPELIAAHEALQAELAKVYAVMSEQWMTHVSRKWGVHRIQADDRNLPDVYAVVSFFTGSRDSVHPTIQAALKRAWELEAS